MAADRPPSEAATTLQITGETTYSESTSNLKLTMVFLCWAFRFQNAWHIGLCDCLSTDRFIPRSVGWKQPMVLGPISTWFHAIHAESH